MVGRGRPYRLRAIHRKMSFTTFERTIPVRPGWKREYYAGKAHVRPSWTRVEFVLPLAPRSADPVAGLRPLEAADAQAVLDAFLDAFRCAPEYADYPMPKYRKRAGEFVRGFFGDVRGRRSPASTVVVRDERVLAAALVKERDGRLPLLDCLLARPEFFRQGLATAVAATAVNRLVGDEHRELLSGAMLANEPSIAWHARFGFRELPSIWVAQARFFSARYEMDRLEKLGLLTDAERERLSALADRWGDEVDRLYKLPLNQQYPQTEA